LIQNTQKIATARAIHLKLDENHSLPENNARNENDSNRTFSPDDDLENNQQRKLRKKNPRRMRAPHRQEQSPTPPKMNRPKRALLNKCIYKMLFCHFRMASMITQTYNRQGWPYFLLPKAVRDHLRLLPGDALLLGQ